MKTALSLVMFLSIAFAAAAEADMRALDLNGDRFVTLAEIRKSVPGLTRSDFRAMDTNDDRRLSATELAASDARMRVSRHVRETEGPAARRFSLRPVTLSEADLDGDGRVSFDELHRLDFPPTGSHRGD